jgi:hypothetical protein
VPFYPYTSPEAKRQGRPPIVQRSGRFTTAHTGCYLSAKAYGEVRLFETALYGALFRGQSKKRHPHALFSSEFLRSTMSIVKICWINIPREN